MKAMNGFYWDEYNQSILTDSLFETNLSKREIANEIGCTELELTKRIRELGLSWVRREGHLSRGQAALTVIMRKLLPGETIVTEEHIGSRLKLDVYCPKYKLGAEYHGRQHFQFVRHFHQDREGFLESQRRDEHKIKLCEELGIALVVFRYCDKLDEDTVYERMLDALRFGSPIKQEEQSIQNPYYERALQRQREYRKRAYRRMKELRNGR